VPGTTVNRLCGSGMDAVSISARQIKTWEADLAIARASKVPALSGAAATRR
jgi:acetyl-CoA acetyltransferase